MIDRKALVKTLKQQHRKLQSDLSEAKQRYESHEVAKTLGLFVQFKADLEEHLNLENGTFYPDYLRISGEQEKIKKFIDEMIAIGATVMKFLDAYNEKEKIEKAQDTFLHELTEIIRVLNLRIEMEEEGLYDLYAES